MKLMDDVIPAMVMKRRGRPKGSKNKPTMPDYTQQDNKISAEFKEKETFVLSEGTEGLNRYQNIDPPQTAFTDPELDRKYEKEAYFVPRTLLELKKNHAPFGSPSSLYRNEACAGNVAFGKNDPEPASSEAAEEGRCFHSVMEHTCPLYLAKSTDKDLQAAFARLIPAKYVDMEERCVKGLEHLLSIWDSFKDKHWDSSIKYEMKIELSPDCYGTSDIVMTGRHKATGKIDVLVWDWKDGRGLVESEDNLQGAAYLLASIATLGIAPGNLGGTMFIVYRTRYEGKEISRWVVTPEQREEYLKRIHNIVTESKAQYEGETPLTLHAGAHCKFCKMSGKCPEEKQEHYDVALLGIQEQEVDIVTTIRRLTLDQQVQVFLKAKYIENFLDALKINLKQALEDGAIHPAVKLIEKRGRRSWRDDIPEEEIAEALIEKGLTTPWQNKLCGLTYAEKALKGKSYINELVEPGGTRYEVVVGTDPREAVMIEGLKELKSE